MNPSPVYNLNQGQQAAADGFFAFLFEQHNEIIISGPGGVGKTYLMGYLIDNIMPRYLHSCELMGVKPEYQTVIMTATTNKAAEVLGVQTNRPTQTIQSFLKLIVKDNYANGTSTLSKARGWDIHKNVIIFIDEASMIDRQLLEFIRSSTHKCKIVYVGDHCQLAPVKEVISPIYQQRLPFYELTEPMRNSEQPALMALCTQLRNTVETGEFLPIKEVPGVIDYMSLEEMEQHINIEFKNPNPKSRILAYTNQQVMSYNDYIRQLREYKEPYLQGETFINNSAVQLPDGMLSVEEEVVIAWLDSGTEHITVEPGVTMEVVRATLRTPYSEEFEDIRLPVDKAHYRALIKYYQNNSNWNRYFYLKNQFPDLRARDSQTVHKSQGSTYETVIIDLSNLSTCHLPKLVARLLYVAVSRAKTRVILFGTLAQKYGGVIPCR